MKKEIYIGLMSGTSIDAIDAAIVEFTSDKQIKILATHSHSMPETLKADIIELCEPGPNGVYRLGKVDIELGNMFARCVLELMNKSKVSTSEVIAIGSHGQTIRHMPNEEIPFTIQIGDPNIITKVTGITTVADFRRRDMAFGGQAAPLAPAFHQYLFQTKESNRFIINLGGIANLTFLPKNLEDKVIGFDTGPGNTLLDNWCYKHIHQPYDNEGRWAREGKINETLLQAMLDDPYFKKAAPKSTGREYFNLAWVSNYLENCADEISVKDVQATLTELTAKSIAKAVKQVHENPTEIFLCGGGVHNQLLSERIQANLPQYKIATTAKVGLDPEWVEAVTFAWLARQTMHHQPGNLPSVTGATRHTILGAIYPTTTH